jgi:hypothetical protein
MRECDETWRAQGWDLDVDLEQRNRFSTVDLHLDFIRFHDNVFRDNCKNLRLQDRK